MMVVAGSRSTAGLFPRTWIPQILDVVAVAWKSLRKPTHDELEPPINSRFCYAIKKRAAELELPFEVQNNHVLHGPDGLMAYLIDICFLDCARPNRGVYLAFECKRLNIVSVADGRLHSRASEYVGSQGMMAYVLGEYAPGLVDAGMVGYVLNGEVERVRQRINANLAKKAEALRIVSETSLIPSPDCREALQTRHDLSGRILIIHHLLLAC